MQLTWKYRKFLTLSIINYSIFCILYKMGKKDLKLNWNKNYLFLCYTSFTIYFIYDIPLKMPEQLIKYLKSEKLKKSLNWTNWFLEFRPKKLNFNSVVFFFSSFLLQFQLLFRWQIWKSLFRSFFQICPKSKDGTS